MVVEDAVVTHRPRPQLGERIDTRILIPLGRHGLQYFKWLEAILKECELVVAIIDKGISGDATGGSAHLKVVHK